MLLPVIFLGVRNNWYQSYNSTIIEIAEQKSQSGPIAWPTTHPFFYFFTVWSFTFKLKHLSLFEFQPEKDKFMVYISTTTHMMLWSKFLLFMLWSTVLRVSAILGISQATLSTKQGPR